MTPAQATDDNRQSRRFESAATLTYFPFTSRKVRSIPVRVLNCSRGGVSILSSKPLKPGQTICIHPQPAEVRSREQRQADALLKPFALGEVRWCHRDAENVEGYSIGVKYL